MTITFKGTFIIDNSQIYSRFDRYWTSPIGKEVAPCLHLVSRRGISIGYEGFITPKFNTAVNNAQERLVESNDSYVALKNSAYARMVGQIGEVAQMGVTIVEGHQIHDMVKTQGRRVNGVVNGFKSILNANDKIVTRVIRLRKAVYALKKGRLSSFAKALKVKPKPEHPSVFKPSDKAVAGYWLEYWFGIAPLISDISNAMKTLASDMPVGRIVGNSVDFGQYISYEPGISWLADLKFRTQVQMGCHIRVENPNTFLNQQLGFSNWLSIGLEVIPFSFFGSWVSNLSQWVGSMTDLSGLEITNPYTSATCKCSSRDILGSPGPATPSDSSFTAVQFRRVTGTQYPKLRWDLPKRLSVTRGATAIALLLQLFT